jgi:hypothetical protein
MALEPNSDLVVVTSTGKNTYSSLLTGPFLVKNTGDGTVYVGRATRSNSDPVNLNTAFPLDPGQSVELPAHDDADTSTYTWGFNTSSGTSQVRVLSSYNA